MKIRYFVFALAAWFVFSTISSAENLSLLKGNINFKDRKLRLMFPFQEGGSVSSDVTLVEDNKVHFDAKLEHIKTTRFVLSMELEGTLEKIDGESNGSSDVKGNFRSRYTLLDYKPAFDLSGKFETKDSRLFLNSLSWGGINLQGVVDLLSPNEINLDVSIDEILSGSVLLLLGYQGDDSQISGVISGQVVLSGFPDRLFVKGQLKAHNGFIEGVEFDTIRLNFEGIYPVVVISDSFILQADGLSYNIKGKFDLAKAQKGLVEGLVGLEKTPMIDDSGLHREWTIKRKQSDENSSVMEFKYRLRQSEDNINPYKEEMDMLGVERSIRF